MITSSPSIATRLAQFMTVVMIAVGIAAWLCPLLDQPDVEWLHTQSGFDPATAKLDLQKRRPDWVLVSNSMLDSRLNERTLSQRSGHTVSQIYRGGSMSAVWFLVMKRIIAESGVKPKVVSLFFRCSDLTWANHKTEGLQERTILALVGKNLPEWRQVMGREGDGPFCLRKEVGKGLDVLFPSYYLSQNSRRSLQNKALRITRGGTRMNNLDRRDELNDRFSLAHLRHDQVSSLGFDAGSDSQEEDSDADNDYDDHGPQKFDPSPEASFLPHMVALARKEGFKLHVHRVKQRPPAKGERKDWLAMKQYMTDLRAYLDQNGCLFTDESQDPELTLDMYGNGDHLSREPDVQKRYLENFWCRMQPLIGGKP